MADNIQQQALSWALTHVRRFGDTDIFPVPFEYEAIAHDWNAIGPFLANVNLEDHKIRPDRRVMVLKPGGGFRAAMQLDPLDHLLYTAAIYEIAAAIENARTPAEQRIACSYRVNITAEGAFFAPENGWKDFHSNSKEIAASGRYSHVLVTDIADFYNQLGQHRIQNGLELARVSVSRSRNIERFLNLLTSKQSQGLPVGPFASILLAETCLIDVDNFLLRQGVSHTRYVDDFHIFCESRKQAIEVRHALAEYLFEVHRLSLETSKSSILYIQKFVENELSDPEELEQEAKVQRLNELLGELWEERGPYWGGEGSPGEDENEVLDQATQESFVGLFESCITRPTLHLGLARHLLRKALLGRTAVLHNLVFENLEALVPVMRDVVRYLVATVSKREAHRRAAQIKSFCEGSDLRNLPFLRMWILELLVRRPDLCPCIEALSYAEGSARLFGIRHCALLASAHNQVDWVRARKETWRNHEAWDRRALIWSTSILPSGEKRPFLSMVIEQGDQLDAALAKYLLNR